MVFCMYGNSDNGNGYYDCCRKKIICSGPRPLPCPAGSNGLSGIQVQLVNSAGHVIEDQAGVLFDSVINRPGLDITYNSCTGEFLLPAGKTYYISWWVAVNGTETVSFPEFAVTVEDQVIAIGTSPLVTCQLSGTALVTNRLVPAVLSLRNVSNDRVRYGETSVQANLVIVEVMTPQWPA